jgi:hypothetical protein
MMMFGYGHWAIWQVSLMWAWMIAFGGLLIGAACALVRIGTAHRSQEANRGTLAWWPVRDSRNSKAAGVARLVARRAADGKA